MQLTDLAAIRFPMSSDPDVALSNLADLVFRTGSLRVTHDARPIANGLLTIYNGAQQPNEVLKQLRRHAAGRLEMKLFVAEGEQSIRCSRVGIRSSRGLCMSVVRQHEDATIARNFFQVYWEEWTDEVARFLSELGLTQDRLDRAGSSLEFDGWFEITEGPTTVFIRPRGKRRVREFQGA
ncbi:MAG: hypothetical protein KDD44_12045 [Bdellovibrionales bacterium]|nr:hypothetical protein [Bdellovibrionales bacterium]